MFKAIVNGVALAMVFLPAATCWLETLIRRDLEYVFLFWTHVFAQLPGLPGIFLRRAFYWLTLDACSLDCYVGYGALFTHRDAIVERDVYIGPYAVVGSVRIREHSLIGTRANLLSGSMHHVMGTDGRWHPGDRDTLGNVEIGPSAWIGEAATVMASVGARSAVAAGAVVAAPVVEAIVVAGNPARFVRRVEPQVTAPQGRVEVGDREPLVPSLH